MRVLCLITHTNTCEPIWRSLESLGHDVTVAQYSDKPYDQHGLFLEFAQHQKPDFIVYVGAVDLCYQGFYVPNTDILNRLNNIAPMVHICCDGCNRVWQPILTMYDEHNCFSAQVSLDGSPHSVLHGPIANGLVKLGLVDPRVFKPKPWHERKVHVGYIGSKGGGERSKVIDALSAQTCGTVSYELMAEFLCDCKFVVNYGYSVVPEDNQVKWRVVEAGFAGACLLERRNSVTELWFHPGHEYISFDDVADAIKTMKTYDAGEASRIADRLYAKVTEKHSPDIFWSDVIQAMFQGLIHNELFKRLTTL